MEQAGEIRARRHVDAGPGLFHGASAADAVAAFENENLFAGTGQIGRTSEAVMTSAHNERVPFHGAPPSRESRIGSRNSRWSISVRCAHCLTQLQSTEIQF